MVEFAGLDSYITDEDYESGRGVIVELDGGQKIRIHRAGGSNEAFVKAKRLALKPYQRKMQRGSFTESDLMKVMTPLYAKHVVVDWEGFIDPDGNPIECNEGNVLALFNVAPEVMNQVMEVAESVTAFLVQRREEDAEALGN